MSTWCACAESARVHSARRRVPSRWCSAARVYRWRACPPSSSDSRHRCGTKQSSGSRRLQTTYCANFGQPECCAHHSSTICHVLNSACLVNGKPCAVLLLLTAQTVNAMHTCRAWASRWLPFRPASRAASRAGRLPRRCSAAATASVLRRDVAASSAKCLPGHDRHAWTACVY